MNIYQEIQELNSNELQEFTKERIALLEEESKEQNGKKVTIGYELDYNPIKNTSSTKPFDIELRCFFSGYVYKGARMVYGMSYDKDGFIGNDGKYYYVDDDSYILDFCNYIKDAEIIDEYELFDYILDFLRLYFDDDKKIIIEDRPNREKMFQMLLADKHSFYAPLKEHGLSWFKGRGNALCSEYSIVANNIMNFLGINSYIVVGHYKTDNSIEGHAYNLISYESNETKEPIDELIDFADYVNILDTNFKKIGISPFITRLNNFDEKLVESLVNGKQHLIFEDYSLIILGDELLKISYGRERDYYIDDRAILEPMKKKTKSVKK